MGARQTQVPGETLHPRHLKRDLLGHIRFCAGESTAPSSCHGPLVT
jgi:hypothetical protein